MTIRDEDLAKIVREAWIAFCLETGDDKPSHIAPWEELSAWDQDADRRIARAVRAALCPPVTPLAPGDFVDITDALRVFHDPQDGDFGVMVMAPGGESEGNYDQIASLGHADDVRALRLACNRWLVAQGGE